MIRLIAIFCILSFDVAALTLEAKGNLDPFVTEALAEQMPQAELLVVGSANQAGDPIAALALAHAIHETQTPVQVKAGAKIEGTALWLLFAARGRITLEGTVEIGLRAWDDGQGHDAIMYPKQLPIHSRVIAIYEMAGLDTETYWDDIARAPLETVWLPEEERDALLDQLLSSPQ